MMFVQHPAGPAAVKKAALQTPRTFEYGVVDRQIGIELQHFFLPNQIQQEIRFLAGPVDGAGTDAERFVETEFADGFPFDENGDGDAGMPGVAERDPAVVPEHVAAGKLSFAVGRQDRHPVQPVVGQVIRDLFQQVFGILAVIVGEGDDLAGGLSQTHISRPGKPRLGSQTPDREFPFEIRNDRAQPVVRILIHQDHLERRRFALDRQRIQKNPHLLHAVYRA